MSERNVELVRRSIDAWTGGDVATGLGLYATDVEVDARHFPEGRVYRGHEGMLKFLRTYIGTFDDFKLEVEEILDAGDEVVVMTRESGRGKGGGVPMEGRFALVLTFEGDRVVRWRGFVDRDEALRAVGLAPP